MDLSIVIVSYNTKELLQNCLKSINLAKDSLKIEVFVVDNSSKDVTVEMVKKDFPWINLIANPQNLGFSKANNQALKKAKGKYILVLNPDTEIQKDTLTKMFDFMEKNTDIGISTCKVLLPNGELDRDCRRHFPTPWRALTHFSGLSKLFPHSKIFDQYYMGYLSQDDEHEVDSCVGAFMMVRKSAMGKVGLFDEDFFFYGEDLDWCWRFRRSGWKIVYTPITKITHFKGAASGMKAVSKKITKASRESKKKALAESTRAMKLFYKKHLEKEYPFLVNWLVLFAVNSIKTLRLLRA